MAIIPVYDTSGAKLREVEVEATTFDKAVRKALLKEAYIAYLASQRQGTHKTKSRAEVAGGGHKPWRQKGTGRARQGSIRSPQWKGGGHALHILPRDYSYRLPSKARAIARRSSLRFHLEAGTLSAVEGLDAQTADRPRTRLVAGFLKAVGLEGKGALIVSEAHAPNLYLSARNIQKVEVIERRNLCAGKILQKANLVFTVGALEGLLKELSA